MSTTDKPTWLLAERFRDVPAIEEAITNFAHDQTGDNATGIVLAVLEHQAATEAAKATGTAGEPMTMSYVQNVPDQCDRITWRGAYYHLKEGAEAALQPAPTLPVKTWQERMGKSGPPITAMQAEIADLRAALAATAAPVLSNISAGLSIPDAKDFDPVGLNPYVVQEADAIPKISLSDDQLDKIARSYFAEEWAQNHLKNAIHDAFITARSQP